MKIIKDIIRQSAKMCDENGKIDYVDFNNYLSTLETMSEEDIHIIGSAITIYTNGIEAAIEDPNIDPVIKLYETLYTPKVKEAVRKFKNVSIGEGNDFRMD